MSMPFAQEQAAYAAIREQLLQDHEGEYVVFDGDRLLAVTPTLFAAWRKGFTDTGRRDLFIEKISREPPVWVAPTFVPA